MDGGIVVDVSPDTPWLVDVIIEEAISVDVITGMVGPIGGPPGPVGPPGPPGSAGPQGATGPAGVSVIPVTVAAPASGTTVALADFSSLYINTGALAALTIKLPPAPASGVVVEIGFANPITVLAVQDAAGSAISTAPTNAYGPGAAIVMRYVSAISWVYWK